MPEEKITITISSITRDQLSYLKETVAEAYGKDPAGYSDDHVIGLAVDRTARELLTAMMEREAQELVHRVKEELRKKFGEDVEIGVAIVDVPDVEPDNGEWDA